MAKPTPAQARQALTDLGRLGARSADIRAGARAYADAAAALERIARDCAAGVAGLMPNWSGGGSDQFLSLWNGSLAWDEGTGGSAGGPSTPIDPRVPASMRYEYSRAAPTLFTAAIDACHDMATALDQYADNLDAQEAACVDLLIGVLLAAAAVVATAVTVGAAGVPLFTFDGGLLAAGVAALSVDVAGTAAGVGIQVANGMIVGHEGLGTSLGRVDWNGAIHQGAIEGVAAFVTTLAGVLAAPILLGVLGSLAAAGGAAEGTFVVGRVLGTLGAAADGAGTALTGALDSPVSRIAFDAGAWGAGSFAGTSAGDALRPGGADPSLSRQSFEIGTVVTLVVETVFHAPAVLGDVSALADTLNGKAAVGAGLPGASDPVTVMVVGEDPLGFRARSGLWNGSALVSTDNPDLVLGTLKVRDGVPVFVPADGGEPFAVTRLAAIGSDGRAVIFTFDAGRAAAEPGATPSSSGPAVTVTTVDEAPTPRGGVGQNGTVLVNGRQRSEFDLGPAGDGPPALPSTGDGPSTLPADAAVRAPVDGAPANGSVEAGRSAGTPAREPDSPATGVLPAPGGATSVAAAEPPAADAGSPAPPEANTPSASAGAVDGAAPPAETGSEPGTFAAAGSSGVGPIWPAAGPPLIGTVRPVVPAGGSSPAAQAAPAVSPRAPDVPGASQPAPEPAQPPRVTVPPGTSLPAPPPDEVSGPVSMPIAAPGDPEVTPPVAAPVPAPTSPGADAAPNQQRAPQPPGQPAPAPGPPGASLHRELTPPLPFVQTPPPLDVPLVRGHEVPALRLTPEVARPQALLPKAPLEVPARAEPDSGGPSPIVTDPEAPGEEPPLPSHLPTIVASATGATDPGTGAKDLYEQIADQLIETVLSAMDDAASRAPAPWPDVERVDTVRAAFPPEPPEPRPVPAPATERAELHVEPPGDAEESDLPLVDEATVLRWMMAAPEARGGGRVITGPGYTPNAAEVEFAARQPRVPAQYFAFFGGDYVRTGANLKYVVPGIGWRALYKPETGVDRTIGKIVADAGWIGDRLYSETWPGSELWREVPEDDFHWLREVAAYRTDHLLGFGLVPTTVEATFPTLGVNGVGSMQEWVPDAAELDPGTLDAVHQQMIAVLDYVIGNEDRNPHNIMGAPRGRVLAIDNGDSFRSADDAGITSDLVVAWLGRRLDDAVLEAVRRLSVDVFADMLRATGIGERAIELACARLGEIQREGMIAGQAYGGVIKRAAR